MKKEKIVAIGLDTQLHEYPWLDGVDCDKFVGSGFFVTAKKMLEEAGCRIMKGQDVIREVTMGGLDASDVYLLQFEESITGQKLLEIGVSRSVLINLESPIFVTDLYLSLKQTSSCFDFCLGLWSSSPGETLALNIMSARFPSYSNADRLSVTAGQPLIPASLDFHQKKMASMIVSKKYWRPVGPKHIFKNLAKPLFIGSAPHRRHQIRRKSLHDTRLRLISYFHTSGLVDVWGSGWDGSGLPFPFNFDRRLRGFTAAPTSGRDEKLRVMSSYRFALVAENTRYPGYVTEKIFDAFMSGTVPIYWGAPDIENFVPADCFIDGKEFESLSDLANFMRKMNEEEHRAFVEAGVKFLSSPEGYAHTFEDFGEKVAGLLLR